MPSVTFKVPGKARPKQRPRVTKRGITFTPKETRNAEAFVREIARQAMAGKEPFEGAIRLSVTVGRSIPRGFSKMKRGRAIAGKVWPTTRPDLDNLVKLIKDSISGICFRDDSQVVVLHAAKVYSDAEETLVTVEEIDGMNPSE